MKTLAFAVLTLAALSTSVLAQGATVVQNVGSGSIKLGKVEPSFASTPEYQITGGQNKRYKLGKWFEMEIAYDTLNELIPELTFKFTALAEKRLFDGEVTYVNIAKGKDHYAVMYISPKALDKITGGKALTPTTIENVWVEVFYNGQSIGKAQFKAGNPPNAQRENGIVLNKSQTPFAPLFYDRYEEIKAVR